MTERKAEWSDLYGAASKRLFAIHTETGRRISAGKFFGLPGERGSMERQGYVLMTTAAKPKNEPKQGRLL